MGKPLDQVHIHGGLLPSWLTDGWRPKPPEPEPEATASVSFVSLVSLELKGSHEFVSAFLNWCLERQVYAAAGSFAVSPQAVVGSFTHADTELIAEWLRERGVKQFDLPRPSFKVAITETHDGEACDCVSDRVRHLSVGDTFTLTHVCVDGRRDELVVAVESVTL